MDENCDENVLDENVLDVLDDEYPDESRDEEFP